MICHRGKLRTSKARPALVNCVEVNVSLSIERPERTDDYKVLSFKEAYIQIFPCLDSATS